MSIQLMGHLPCTVKFANTSHARPQRVDANQLHQLVDHMRLLRRAPLEVTPNPQRPEESIILERCRDKFQLSDSRHNPNNPSQMIHSLYRIDEQGEIKSASGTLFTGIRDEIAVEPIPVLDILTQIGYMPH